MHLFTTRKDFLYPIIAILLLFTFSCQQEPNSLDRVVVRISDDPDRLNPIIARSTVAYQVMNKIFQPLVDFDPQTLQLAPVLLEVMPEAIAVDTGQYAGFFRADLKLLEGAAWEDGIPVTAKDVRFSLNTILICEWYGAGPPGLMTSLVAMEPGEDEQSFTYYLKDGSSFGAYNLMLMPVLPAHIYDPENLISEMDLNEAISTGSSEWLTKYDNINSFAESFNSTLYSREIISGSGPYEFDSWRDDQLIILKKKENYWADQMADKRSVLTAHPLEIAYRIITDEISAIEALKEGTVDIVGDFSPDQFILLRDNDSLQINTYSPDVLQYYYTALNNKDPLLSDPRVRNALAMLLPVDDIIEQLFNGLASRIVGPIHPAKPFYNTALVPVKHNIKGAQQLLEEAGWTDSDDNGILDKELNGVKTELTLSLLTSPRKLGQDLSLIFQQEAAKAGVQINIDVVDNPTLLKNISEKSYQMANLASRFNPGLDELFSTWHSQSSSGSGNNITSFSDPTVDSLIVAIQGRDLLIDQMYDSYAEFQRLIYKLQPVIFICAPKERIAARSGIDLPTTLMKPGYLEQLAQPAN